MNAEKLSRVETHIEIIECAIDQIGLSAGVNARGRLPRSRSSRGTPAVVRGGKHECREWMLLRDVREHLDEIVARHAHINKRGVGQRCTS
jgi:hypothetical protein